MDLSERFLGDLRAEFPAFRIVPKRRDPFSRAIDLALRLVTFNGQRHYLTHYHTVIGDTLYVPDTWDALADLDRVILLRHERVHLRQRRRYGAALMAFLYLVPFLPLGLAYGRARIEWEAYVETLRATAELCGLPAARDPQLRERIVRRFTGPDYGWMWPFRASVERWYDRALQELARDSGLEGAA
ncbi:MAG: hypothetical protein EOO73_29965 [Myxococcales bacterium]|nr:MAG: hypothetical protein EOO73_29965 [Myxococcales bacterium]